MIYQFHLRKRVYHAPSGGYHWIVVDALGNCYARSRRPVQTQSAAREAVLAALRKMVSQQQPQSPHEHAARTTD